MDTYTSSRTQSLNLSRVTGKSASADGNIGTFRARLATFCAEHNRVVIENTRLQQVLREWFLEISFECEENDVVERDNTFEERVPSERSMSMRCLSLNHCSSSSPPSRMEQGLSPRSELVRDGVHANDLLSGTTPTQEGVVARESTSTGGAVAFEATLTNNSGYDSRPTQMNTRRTMARSDVEGLVMQGEGGKKARLIAGNSKFLEDVAKKSSKRRLAALVVSHRHFENVVACVIVANVIFMGWSTNYTVYNWETMDARLMASINFLFFLFYMVELLLRIVAFGNHFFRKPDRNWNLFDAVLVFQGLSEQVLYWFGLDDHSQGGFSFLRAIRLGKLVKMLRVIRLMRSMREMRVILFSIMGCISGMFWSILMIGAVLYMFSLIFVQACGDYLQEQGANVDPATKRDLLHYWGSVEESMVTLFIASTGGDDWVRLVKPLLQCGYVYYGFFCLYIAFYLCVLMNTITALFVESTFMTATRDHQYTIQSVMEKKAEYVQSLKMLFHEADADGDGMISLEEFCSRLGDPKMRAFAESLHIEIGDAESFFMLLTDGGKSPIDLESFVMSCIRMRGQALAIDLQDLLMRQKLTDARNDSRMKRLQRMIEKLESLNYQVAQDVKMLQAFQLPERSRVFTGMSNTRDLQSLSAPSNTRDLSLVSIIGSKQLLGTQSLTPSSQLCSPANAMSPLSKNPIPRSV